MRGERGSFNRTVLLLTGIMCFSVNGFSQTKAELQATIDRQTRTIDSLNAVVANYENIVETRDRSIKFLNMDKDELNQDIAELNDMVRQRNTEIARLKGQTATGVAKKTTLTNTRNSMTVPEGKYWVINQFIGDYITPLVTDSTGVTTGYEIFVFLETLNGETLTRPRAKQIRPAALQLDDALPEHPLPAYTHGRH